MVKVLVYNVNELVSGAYNAKPVLVDIVTRVEPNQKALQHLHEVPRMGCLALEHRVRGGFYLDVFLTQPREALAVRGTKLVIDFQNVPHMCCILAAKLPPGAMSLMSATMLPAMCKKVQRKSVCTASGQ